MTPRAPLRPLPLLVAFLLPLLAAAAPAASAAGLEGSKLNLIVVITDDQGYGPVGRHGHPWIRPPISTGSMTRAPDSPPSTSPRPAPRPGPRS